MVKLPVNILRIIGLNAFSLSAETCKSELTAQYITALRTRLYNDKLQRAA